MKKQENGFSLIEVVIVLIITSIICSLGYVGYNRYVRKTKAFAARTALKNIKSECKSNSDLGLQEKFSLFDLNSYSINTREKNSCLGEIENGLVILLPNNINYLPTYSYNFDTGAINCSYNGFIKGLFNECLSLKSKLEKYKFVVKDSYKERGCSAYVIVKGPSWEEAENNSQKLGGHLVTINDVDENKWIVSSYQNLVTYNNVTGDIKGSADKLPRAWIGLNDRDKEGEYKWSSGQEVTYRGTIDSGHFSGMKKTYGRFDPKTGLRDDSLPLVNQFIDQDVSSITLANPSGDKFWVEGSWEDNWNNYTHYSDGIAEIPTCFE